MDLTYFPCNGTRLYPFLTSSAVLRYSRHSVDGYTYTSKRLALYSFAIQCLRADKYRERKIFNYMGFSQHNNKLNNNYVYK